MSLIKKIKIVYKDSESVINISNTNYKTFKSFNVSRSIDDVAGSFRITISRPSGNVSPFKVGNTIDIVLDDVQVMRGKIYESHVEGDSTNDDIIFSGRDITGDIIDSSVPDDSKVYVKGANLVTITEKILKSLGLESAIRVVDRSGAVIKSFDESEIVSCNVGDTVIEFLIKYCRKRQLFLNTDVRGDLIFFKAEGKKTGNRIINEKSNNDNNVISYSVKFNTSNRFNRYICKSQDSEAWVGGEDATVDSFGEAFDFEIEDSRIHEFKMEEDSPSSAECQARAAEEANVRRARGFEYKVTVQGFRDKVAWAINQFVNVSDDKAGVYGEFLIKGVEFKLDSQRGRITKLTIVNRDAYTAEAAINLRTSKEQNAGTVWVGSVKEVIETTKRFLKGEDL